MWILFKISAIGVNLLLLTHIAHTFVLLTANIDDVKSLAKKFVSDTLAEKITDFIVRATANIGEQDSEETQAKDVSHHLSEENTNYNNAAVHESEQEKSKEVGGDQPASLQYVVETPVNKATMLKDNKEIYTKSNKKNTKGSDKQKTNKNMKQYAYLLEGTTHKLTKDIDNYSKDSIISSKYIKDSFDDATSVGPMKIVHVSSIEDNDVTERVENTTVDEFSENELFDQKQASETPVKEVKPKNYIKKDSKNYAVATSGSIILSIPEKRSKIDDSFWEKDDPKSERSPIIEDEIE